MKVNVGDKVLVASGDFRIYGGILVGEVVATSTSECEFLVGFKNYRGHCGNGAPMRECNYELLNKYCNMCWWITYDDILEIK